MASGHQSISFKSLYLARFTLEIIGILLLIFALFNFVLAHFPATAVRGLVARMITGSALLLASGIGLILPWIWAKLSGSLILTITATWLLVHDAQWPSYLGVYVLMFVPLSLTIWLWAGYKKMGIERLPNASEV